MPPYATVDHGTIDFRRATKKSYTYNAERVLGSGSFGVVYQAQPSERAFVIRLLGILQQPVRVIISVFIISLDNP